MNAAVASIWRALRTLVGDEAYDRDCAHVRAEHPNTPLLARRAVYLQRQQQKWSGENRCC